jgi:MraZ protein
MSKKSNPPKPSIPATQSKQAKPLPRYIYVGTYRRRLDKDGRMRLPHYWRSAMDGNGLGLFLSDKAVIHIWTKKQVDVAHEKLNRANKTRGVSKKQLTEWQSELAKIQLVTMDAYGRFRVPAELRHAARLERDVIAVGCFNRIQLWQPRLWKAEMAQG